MQVLHQMRNSCTSRPQAVQSAEVVEKIIAALSLNRHEATRLSLAHRQSGQKGVAHGTSGRTWPFQPHGFQWLPAMVYKSVKSAAWNARSQERARAAQVRANQLDAEAIQALSQVVSGEELNRMCREWERGERQI